MGFSHHFLLIRSHEVPIYSVTNATRAINLIKASYAILLKWRSWGLWLVCTQWKLIKWDSSSLACGLSQIVSASPTISSENTKQHFSARLSGHYWDPHLRHSVEKVGEANTKVLGWESRISTSEVGMLYKSEGTTELFYINDGSLMIYCKQMSVNY